MNGVATILRSLKFSLHIELQDLAAWLATKAVDFVVRPKVHFAHDILVPGEIFTFANIPFGCAVRPGQFTA